MPEEPTPTPDEIIARVRAGDIDAYGLLVERYQNLILGIACQRLGDAAQARDIAQLTFIRAYEQLEDFRPGADFGTWLCVICRYMILTERERRNRQRRNVGRYEGELREMIGEELSAGEPAEGAAPEALAALRQCIGELRGGKAELLQMRYYQEMSCREIAERRGRKVTWVTTTLSRVRAQLRTCVERRMHAVAP